MPKLKNRVPSYRRHKPTGQGVVTLNGRDVYLGKYNSPASRQEYNRLIAEWTARKGSPVEHSHDLTVGELLSAFWKHAQQYYRRPDGRPATEQTHYRLVMRRVKSLYSRTRAVEFGPMALKAVRQGMIADGWARRTINQGINRIRHIFKWGTENQLVPPTVLHGLQAVSGLRQGRTEARETEPIKPVPEAFVRATVDYVVPQVAAMIELQSVTGMRSGEVTIMRGCDINMAGKVWLYTPETHKTAWHGHERKIYLGPKAQEIIRPFFKADLQAHLFSPADAVAEQIMARSENRNTPLSCGNRPGTNRKPNPKRRPRDHYDTGSYYRAVARGIEQANKARLAAAKKQAESEKRKFEPDQVELIPHWHPHQLRHNAATNLRREHGIEIARIILGHRSAAITEVYAEVDHARAIDVMAKIG